MAEIYTYFPKRDKHCRLIRGDKYSLIRNSYPRESNFIRRILALAASYRYLPSGTFEVKPPIHRLFGIGRRRPLVRGSGNQPTDI
jgi:hypothetical protein